MKIAVISDYKNFQAFIAENNLPKDDFKCVSKPHHVEGYRFDYYVVLYTFLDIGDCQRALIQLKVPHINEESLILLYNKL